MKETWRDIEGYEGYYQASDKGRIRSVPRITAYGKRFRKLKGKVLKPAITSTGYLCVNLSKGGTWKRTRAHRIIAKTFIENLENKPQVNHINGIKSDNRIENLEWCTCLENIKHASENGLKKSNKGTRGCRLKETEVIEIRKKHQTGNYTQMQLLKQYNVSQTTIRRIVNNKTWKHI